MNLFENLSVCVEDVAAICDFLPVPYTEPV